MTHLTPQVTVVMPVFNAAPYLPAALDSLLAQTLTAFEVIAVDDGSTDESPEILARYAGQDPRIRLVRQANQGQAVAAHHGQLLAQTDLIARMDADDISLPDRLQRQTRFLAQHPEVALVGAWMRTIGAGPVETWRFPTGHHAICSRMVFANPIGQSSILYRRSAFERHDLHYRPGTFAEDFELWSRAARHLTLANLPEVLTLYRKHAVQTSVTMRRATDETADEVRERELRHLGLTPSHADLEFHHRLSAGPLAVDEDSLRMAREWLERLGQHNDQHARLDPVAFRKELGAQWIRVCRQQLGLGYVVWRHFASTWLCRLSGPVARGRLGLEVAWDLIRTSATRYGPSSWRAGRAS